MPTMDREKWNKKIGEGQRERFARIRAMAEAGESVLAAAETGDRELLARVARVKLAEIRDQFGDEPLVIRLNPPREEAS